MSKTTSKVFSGAIWMVFLRLSVKGLGFINTIILARILTPSDFGIVAVVMAIYSFIDLIKRFGFDVVLIQKQDVERSDYDTAWTFKFIFGFLAALVFLILSPFIADYYDDQRLTTISICVSMMFFLNGITNIGVVNFIKDFNFKKEFKFRLWIKVLTIVVTIAVALCVKSYWALVVGMLSAALWEVVLSFRWSSYRPRISFRKWKELYSFSGWLMTNNILQYFYNQFSGLIIAKMLSPAMVGIYKVTTEFSNLPSGELAASINKASYPGYAKVAQDVQELRNLYLKILSSIALIAIPISVLIALLAPYFVPLVLGDQWISGVPVMEVLSLSQILMCINSNAGYIYLAMGKPKLGTLLLFIRVCLLLGLIYWLIDLYGLIGAAYAYAITSVVMFPLTFFMLRKLISLKLFDYLASFYRPLFASSVTYFVGLQMRDFMHLDGLFLTFVLYGGGMSLLYLAVHWAVWYSAADRWNSPEANIFKSLKQKIDDRKVI